MKTKKSLTSPIDAELSTLRAKVAKRREYLDLLEIELANTRGALQEFTDLYNARITPLENEQKRLQQMLEDLTVDQAPPSNDWRGKRGKQNGSKANDSWHHHEARIPLDKKPLADRDPDYERKVRDLFRKLAKQYHPDMARGEQQKKRHEEIMSEINQAFSVKDLDALEALAKRNGHHGKPSNSPSAEISRLETELHQLETMIFEVEHTIRELDLSPAMQMRSELRADQNDGRDAFADLEAEFKTRISLLQEQLLALGADLNSINLGTN